MGGQVSTWPHREGRGHGPAPMGEKGHDPAPVGGKGHDPAQWGMEAWPDSSQPCREGGRHGPALQREWAWPGPKLQPHRGKEVCPSLNPEAREVWPSPTREGVTIWPSPAHTAWGLGCGNLAAGRGEILMVTAYPLPDFPIHA